MEFLFFALFNFSVVVINSTNSFTIPERSSAIIVVDNTVSGSCIEQFLLSSDAIVNLFKFCISFEFLIKTLTISVEFILVFVAYFVLILDFMTSLHFNIIINTTNDSAVPELPGAISIVDNAVIGSNSLISIFQVESFSLSLKSLSFIFFTDGLLGLSICDISFSFFCLLHIFLWLFLCLGNMLLNRSTSFFIKRIKIIS